MIVPDSPNLKIGLKRSELVLGNGYVIKQKVRGGPGRLTYRHVRLLDLVSGNRAVVQWDEPCWMDDAGHRGRPIEETPTRTRGLTAGKRVRVLHISCAQILATEDDWERFPHVWNAKRKCLMLDMTEIMGEQGAMV